MPTAYVTIRPEPYYRKAAVMDGLERVGYEAVDIFTFWSMGRWWPVRPECTGDLLVVWNLKAGPPEEVARQFERRGGTVLVMENGYLQKEDKTTYALSTHGHNGAGWHPVGDEDRFTPMGFVHQPWREDGEHILVCGQRGVGSKRMASPLGWSNTKSVNLRFVFREREVRHRPHPGNHKPRVDIDDDLRGAHSCVIWSSACGVRALVRGIPVFYDAPHWICADVAHRPGALKPGFIEPMFHYDDVHDSLKRMAWGQWQIWEIEAGLPFARMMAENWGPRFPTL